MQPDQFDLWRSNYRGSSVEDHADFYRRIHSEYPDQKHYNLEAVLAFLGAVQERRFMVVELGGYDGALAKECLEATGRIQSWANYDICFPEILQPSDRRYVAIKLEQQFWEMSVLPHAEVFVASHVIEHLDRPDFLALLDCIQLVPYVFLDSPLGDSVAVDWTGATAAHVLDLSWDDVVRAMELRGFELLATNGSSRSFRRMP